LQSVWAILLGGWVAAVPPVACVGGGESSHPAKTPALAKTILHYSSIEKLL